VLMRPLHGTSVGHTLLVGLGRSTASCRRSVSVVLRHVYAFFRIARWWRWLRAHVCFAVTSVWGDARWCTRLTHRLFDHTHTPRALLTCHHHHHSKVPILRQTAMSESVSAVCAVCNCVAVSNRRLRKMHGTTRTQLNTHKLRLQRKQARC
jgi:hypothetical protein